MSFCQRPQYTRSSSEPSAQYTGGSFCNQGRQCKSLKENDPAMMSKIRRAIARVESKNIRSMNERLMKALIIY